MYNIKVIHPKWYMFVLAKIFGKKLNDGVYQWRNTIWVTKDVTDAFHEKEETK